MGEQGVMDKVNRLKTQLGSTVADIGMFRRMNWLAQALFNGRRNLYEVFGYTSNPTYEQKFIKYLRQDIAGRIVDAPASALWTNPPTITANSDDWNKAWQDLTAKYNLWDALEKADKLAGIGRFSIILIGFNDGGALDQPVNTRSLKQKGQKLLFLQPYSELSTKIKTVNADPSSEDYMKPLVYTIQPMKEMALGYGGQVKTALWESFDVHASRIIHIAENTLENTIYGSPRLERVYNTLDDLIKVTGGSAETFWLTANRGLHIDVDPELEFDSNDAKNLADEVDEYVHQLRRVIRTRGTKVSSLGSESPDPTGTYSMLISQLSGATGIPRRILTGTEAGQLASEQDRANWADRIDERRNGWANPSVVHPAIKKFTNAGYLPTQEDIQITVTWPSAFKMSPLEEAQTSAQHARSATNFAKAIETMEKMKRGEPGQEAQTDEEGNPIPGTEKPAIEGIAFEEDLITIPEARKFIGLDKEKVTYNSAADVTSNPSTQRNRR